jgi:two-component system response regulator YesN
MTRAADTFRRLEQDARNIYSLKSAVFRHGAEYQKTNPPDIDPVQWQNALLEQNTDLILDEIRNWLGSGNGKIIDRSLMNILYHQLLGAVYFALNLHHLPAHQPFLDKNVTNAFNSIPDFELWAEDALENTMSLLSSREASSTLVATLRQYIRDNLDSELSRTQIANVVYLNPDYLSTLFRKKSGVSLSRFITMERIAAAKKLLISTDLPINEIAVRTGFQNVSYFSKQFKRLEKQTPLGYRNKREGK